MKEQIISNFSIPTNIKVVPIITNPNATKRHLLSGKFGKEIKYNGSINNNKDIEINPEVKLNQYILQILGKNPKNRWTISEISNDTNNTRQTIIRDIIKPLKKLNLLIIKKCDKDKRKNMYSLKVNEYCLFQEQNSQQFKARQEAEKLLTYFQKNDTITINQAKKILNIKHWDTVKRILKQFENVFLDYDEEKKLYIKDTTRYNALMSSVDDLKKEIILNDYIKQLPYLDV